MSSNAPPTPPAPPLPDRHPNTVPGPAASGPPAQAPGVMVRTVSYFDDPTTISEPDSHATRRRSVHVNPPPGEEGWVTKSVASADDEGDKSLHDTDLSDPSDSNSNSTGMSDPRNAAKAGTTSIRFCGRKVRVPFTVWTCLAMAVPIALVIIATTMELQATAHELHVVRSHVTVTRHIGECASWMMRERGTLGPWLARGNESDFARLEVVRDGMRHACVVNLGGTLLELSAASNSFAAEWRAAYHRFQQLLRDVAVARVGVDARNASGAAVRRFFTTGITSIADMVIIVANKLEVQGRRFAELRLLVETRNYIGLARGIGNAIAAQPVGAADPGMLQEYIGGHAKAEVGYSALLGSSSPTLNRDVIAWRALPVAERMWQLIDTMADVNGGGVEAVQRTDAAAWWPDVSAGLAALADVEQAHLDRLDAADDAEANVAETAALLACGVVLCVVAAGLLAWQQARVRRQLESQVAAVTRTREAVAAFVPKFFLRKMGYTSITQVRVGECTEVALAMLFSDIRRFTTVSEGMASRDLFDWVQGYFKRMTAIVDARRGNVNQFIGDALFAVFPTCADSLYCAVDMQADVQQLNVQRLCDDERTVPIAIGVGIHHDVVAMGILGDEQRHTCTTISASVNLASRLEGLTKQLGCAIIASGPVIHQLTEDEADTLRFRKLGLARVKGASTEIAVFDVFQTDAREMQLYKQQTVAAFEAVATAHLAGTLAPGDRQRLRDFLAQRRAEMQRLLTPDANTHAATGDDRRLSAEFDRLSTNGIERQSSTVRAAAASAGTLMQAACEFGVRDEALEVILSLPEGAKAMIFEAK